MRQSYGRNYKISQGFRAIAAHLSDLDKAILNALQTGVALDRRPYADLAQQLDSTEELVIDAVKRHRESGLIREISGIFDAKALGYQSTLAAMQVSPDRLEDAAGVVSEHSGVSHNYSRNHAFNLWFTLTVPEDADLEQELLDLSERAGGWHFRNFPTVRVFKIGVRFDLTGDHAAGSPEYNAPEPVEVDDLAKAAVRALQKDLPAEPEPFAKLAGSEGLETQELLEQGRRFALCGALRRYGAVLRHRQAGYIANLMSAWDLDDKELEQAARLLAAMPAVSHCYERTTYPDWPYRLFAMLHARSEDRCIEAVEEVAKSVGTRKFVLLRSVHEYKKQRVRFFV